MSVSTLTHIALGVLALVGAAAITAALMLASPVRSPPPLVSIHEGAMRIDAAGAPDLMRFQAATEPGSPTGSIRRRTERETVSQFWPTAPRPVRSRCMWSRRRSLKPG
jgi:hypothetical protein